MKCEKECKEQLCKECAEVYAVCDCCDEVCHQDREILGCCSDGNCPYQVENMCQQCSEHDEDEDVHRCGQCVTDKEEEEEEEEEE